MHRPTTPATHPDLPLDFIRLLYGLSAQAQTMIEEERARWDTMLKALETTVSEVRQTPAEVDNDGHDRKRRELALVLRELTSDCPGADALAELQRKINLLADTYKLLLMDYAGHTQRIRAAVYTLHQPSHEEREAARPTTFLHC